MGLLSVQEIVNPQPSIEHGQKTVSSAGTAEALVASSTKIRQGVYIKALEGNSGTVYVGDSDVSSSNGYELAAGDVVFLAVRDLADIYLDVSSGGEGASFLAV